MHNLIEFSNFSYCEVAYGATAGYKPVIGAGTGKDGRAVKVSRGALLEGKGLCTERPSCPSGCATWPVNTDWSAKRVRPCSGVLGPADPAPVSD